MTWIHTRTGGQRAKMMKMVQSDRSKVRYINKQQPKLFAIFFSRINRDAHVIEQRKIHPHFTRAWGLSEAK